MNIFECHEEADRFYISTTQWFRYVMLGGGALILGGVGFFFFLSDDAPLFVSVILMIGSFICLIGCFGDENGKHMKQYGFKGQLDWGADEKGIFVSSPEMKLSYYEWGRIKKIIVTEKLLYREEYEDQTIVKGIYINGGIRIQGLKQSKVPKAIVIYVDSINEPEGKLQKVFYDANLKDIQAFSKTYGPLDTLRLEFLLKKYKTREVKIEFREEWDLDA